MAAQKAEAPVTPEAPERKAATLAEIKAAFGSRPAFVIEQLEAGATMGEARVAFLQLELEEERAKTAELSAKVEEISSQPLARGKASGVDPTKLASGGSEELDGDADFLGRAREMAEQDGTTVTAAMQRLAKQNPQLHEAYRAKCSSMRAKKGA